MGLKEIEMKSGDLKQVFSNIKNTQFILWELIQTKIEVT